MSGSAQLPEALASASAGSQALLQRLGGMVAAEVLESAEPPATPSLALLGETNRGKSSLVNALLAMRHCSPVAADAATATSLVFGYAERGCTTARYTDGRRDHSVRPSELAELVTVVAGAVQRRLPPHHVEVLLPNPLTRRLTLVDTPGVGGLHSRHGELAGHAAAEATAALFVVDASAPLTAGELDFLTEVAERIETVVFALTKIDAFRGAQQVLEADRALVASRLPGFADAPWFAVSARLHELAEQATDATAAQLLRERSGIGELRTWLQELLLGRAKMLSEANALRAVDTALAGCRVDLASAGRACSAGDAERAALRARRDELSSARRAVGRGWALTLRSEMARVRLASTHQVAGRVRDLQSWFRGAIDTADRSTLARLPAEVDAGLQVLSGEVSVQLNRSLSTLTETVLAELFTADERAVIRARVSATPVAPVELRERTERSATAEDRLMISMGVYSGFGIARLASSSVVSLAGLGAAALNPLVLPVTIVIGLGAGWWVARTRALQADKHHVRQWLIEAIAEARSGLEHEVSAQLIAAEQQLSSALGEAMAARLDGIDAELALLDANHALQRTERANRLAAITGDLAAIDSARARNADLLAALRRLRDR